MQSSLYNISYIVYFTWSIYKEYRPSVCVLGCDIALGPAALGLYHILGHTLQVYIFVYRPGSILYTIHIYLFPFLGNRRNRYISAYIVQCDHIPLMWSGPIYCI